MVTENYNTCTKSGMFGGTFLALLVQLNWANVFNTIIVAAVGAATSFIVSVLLRYVSRKYFR